jgi:hypothetical protein
MSGSAQFDSLDKRKTCRRFSPNHRRNLLDSTVPRVLPDEYIFESVASFC